MARTADPRAEVQATKTLLRKEVLRQVVAPARVLQNRLLLYYLPRLRLTRPWMSAKTALTELVESGAIVPEEVDGVDGPVLWYRLPHVQSAKLTEALATKPPVYAAWTRALAAGGAHAERLWRDAFRSQGWVVPDSQVLVPCPAPDDGDATHGEKHEIDVYATLPGTVHTVAAEVRNGPGEGWLGPDIVRDWKLTKAQRNIRHHFSAMQTIGLTPMLLAPFVDPSFYPFQTNYRGAHFRYLYNIFAPRDATIAASVKETFGIGHVWAETEPPESFLKAVRRLPTMLAPRDTE